jgi:tetratricopeptide (TPR) repeat protein
MMDNMKRPCFLFATRLTLVAAIIAIHAVEARAQDALYDELLRIYRSGASDRAVAEFDKALLPDGQEAANDWIQHALRQKRKTDLEAALLLCSESIMRAWSLDQVYPLRTLKGRFRTFDRLRVAVNRLDRKSLFLRAWYLSWESFRQANVHFPPPAEMDFLDEALDAFPKDGQLLLAAGSREELNWRSSFENAQRDPSGEAPSVKRYLIAARDMLRRSLSADPKESEARLRLGRVLLELGEVEHASRVLGEHDWKADGPGFEYLARLFQGEVHERRGDVAAAAHAYDVAISLIKAPQSARIARAHLAHRLGLRSEAASTVMAALSPSPAELDPWWLYIRGQTWRFEGYLKLARSLVRRP